MIKGQHSLTITTIRTKEQSIALIKRFSPNLSQLKNLEFYKGKKLLKFATSALEGTIYF